MKFYALVFMIIAASGFAPVSAEHTCDPPAEGGSVMATTEIVEVSDGAPYQADGDWVVERTTRLLPLCNYFSPVGSYSLKSYSLDPFTRIDRVVLCRATTPVGSYTGPCPPK